MILGDYVGGVFDGVFDCEEVLNFRGGIKPELVEISVKPDAAVVDENDAIMNSRHQV